MTRFLASVTGADEAQIALAHGADIIDLKDVSKGALAALPPAEVRAAVCAVGGRRPVSAVAGDVDAGGEDAAVSVAAMAGTGVDYVKLGLAPGAADGVRALASLARRTKLVGVMFADIPIDHTLVPRLAECGFAGVMLDTSRKGQGGLLTHMDVGTLHAFIGRCRELGLTVGLAGSLEPPDIPRLLLLAPDFLGFRTALCAGMDRSGPLDPAAIRLVRDLVGADRTGQRVDAVQVETLARGYVAETEVATDRVFVRDFVMPVRIGAYNRERREPQNVRFNVEVEVARSSRANDLRDVFSYDVILDGIRIITSQEHISLVEILAERIATFILTHPCVVTTIVQVEKLDVGPGAVGIEIRRERKAEVAQVHDLFPTTLAAE